MIDNPGCYSCKYIEKSQGMHLTDMCNHPKNKRIEHGYAYDFDVYIEDASEKNKFRNCPDFEEKIKIKKWWKK